jgi:predicted hydrocarbon binding protein
MPSTIQTETPQIVATPPRSSRDACHYSRSQFFRFEPEQGKIKDYNHQRNLLVGEDFIVSLLKGLEHEVGEAAGWLCYQIGFDWGKQDAVLFQAWFQEYYGLTIEKANLAFAIETWWWPYTAQGWGTWSPNLSNRDSGFFYVDVFDSAVAKSLGYVGKPVCMLDYWLASLVPLSTKIFVAPKFNAMPWVMIFVDFWLVLKIALEPQNFGLLQGLMPMRLQNALKLEKSLLYRTY